jgi:hypothetical protein
MASRSGDAVTLTYAKPAVRRTATLVAGAIVLSLSFGAGVVHAQGGETGKGTVYPQAYALLSSAAQKERAANDPGARAMQNAASTLYTLNAVVLLSPGNHGDPWMDRVVAEARGPAVRACISLFSRQLIFIYRRDPHGADTAVAVVRMIAGEKGVALLKDADFLTGNIPAVLVPYARSSKVAANELEQTIGTASKDNPLAGPIASPPARRPNPHAAENAQKPEVQATPSFDATYKLMQQLGADAAGSFMAWTALAAEDQENGLPGEKNDHVGTGALVFLWRPAIDHVNDVFHQEFAFALARLQATRPGAGDAWLKQLYGAQNAEGAAKAITALDGIGAPSELGKNRTAQDHLHSLIGQVAGLMTRVQYKAGAFYSTGY